MADINIENLNKDRITIVDEIKRKQENCVSLSNAAELVEQLRSNSNNVWMLQAADAIEQLVTKCDRLTTENRQLKKDLGSTTSACDYCSGRSCKNNVLDSGGCKFEWRGVPKN